MTDWQAVVDQHTSLVWQTAYRLLGNHADADDCFQETFLAALKLARRQPIEHWPALLARLSTRRALDRLRQRMRDAARRENPGRWAAIASAEPRLTHPSRRLRARFASTALARSPGRSSR